MEIIQHEDVIMTTQLIPVFNGTISNERSLLVNARDLHRFLGVGKRFASWITDRISEYELAEGEDFVIASQIREAKTRGGHNRKDYHLTLDTAKELAMVERNEKGRQIRRYFIECEKKLRNTTPPSIPRRWLLTIDHTGRQSAVPVPMNACVMSPEEFLESIQNNSVSVDDEVLLRFIAGYLLTAHRKCQSLLALNTGHNHS
jgi:phage anti-repressor protein